MSFTLNPQGTASAIISGNSSTQQAKWVIHWRASQCTGLWHFKSVNISRALPEVWLCIFVGGYYK